MNRFTDYRTYTWVDHGGFGILFIEFGTDNDDPGHEIAFPDEILKLLQEFDPAPIGQVQVDHDEVRKLFSLPGS